MSPSTSSPPKPSRRVWPLVAAVMIALIAAVTVKYAGEAGTPQSDATAAPPAANGVALLSAMPEPDRATATGQMRAKALDAVRKAPANPVPWIALGDAWAQEQRDTLLPKCYDCAETCYREALRLQPRNATALVGMAWTTGGRHQFDQSIDWAQKALAVSQDTPAAHGVLGDAYLELGRYEEALDSYQRMTDLRPDLSSWSRGAHLLWLMGQKSKALWLMERAIRAGAPFAENTAWCRARLAMMLLNDGALPAAAQAVAPAVEAGSRHVPLLLAAARIATAQGDAAEAERLYRKILENGPQLEALAALGDLATAAGDKEKAEAFFVQVEEVHSRNASTGVHDHMAMARFLADHDRKPAEALRLAEPAKLTENVIEADTLAWVYFKSGDLPKAIAAMKKALRLNTQDAEMHFHAGMIAAGAGDRVSAQKHLQTALSFNPHFHPLHVTTALATLERLGSSTTAHADPNPAAK